MDCCQSFSDCFYPLFIFRTACACVCLFHVKCLFGTSLAFQGNSIKSNCNHIHLHPFPLRRPMLKAPCSMLHAPHWLTGNVSLKFEFILQITNSQHVCHSAVLLAFLLLLLPIFGWFIYFFWKSPRPPPPPWSSMGFSLFWSSTAIFNCAALLLVSLGVLYIHIDFVPTSD